MMLMPLDLDSLRIVFPAIAVGAFIWPIAFYSGRQYERMRAQVAAQSAEELPTSSRWARVEQLITRRFDEVVQNAERLIARLEERAAPAPVEHPPPTPVATASSPQPAASAESDLAALRAQLATLDAKPTT